MKLNKKTLEALIITELVKFGVELNSIEQEKLGEELTKVLREKEFNSLIAITKEEFNNILTEFFVKFLPGINKKLVKDPEDIENEKDILGPQEPLKAHYMAAFKKACKDSKALTDSSFPYVFISINDITIVIDLISTAEKDYYLKVEYMSSVIENISLIETEYDQLMKIYTESYQLLQEKIAEEAQSIKEKGWEAINKYITPYSKK